DARPADGPVVVATLDVTTGLHPGAPPARMEARLDTRALLQRVSAATAGKAACTLENAGRVMLASDAPAGTGPATGPRVEVAEATLDADGWGAASPWSLHCVRPGEPAAALLDPIASRSRLTIVLNLVVMALAVLLGSFVLQQSRRRQMMEAE